MQNPDLKVFDKNFNLLGVIDSYTSFQGERRLWEVGEMELHLAFDAPYANTLNEGNLVYLSETRVWEITERTEKEKSLPELIILGRELKGFLDARMVIPDAKDDTHYFGFDRYPELGEPDAPAESIMKYYINKHAVNPAEMKRKFPNLVLSVDAKRGLSLRWSARFVRLTELLAEIGVYSGLGYVVRFLPDSEQMHFDVIPETDATQNSLHPVIFALDFENIESMERTRSRKDYYTHAYAGGSGTDEERLILSVPRTDTEVNSSGFGRIETWIDAGSLSEVADLQNEAKYQLLKNEKTDLIEADTVLGKSFPYLTAWDIGTVVTLRSAALNFELDKKITAVREVYERGKMQVIPTFGQRRKDIRDEIRTRKVVQ